MGVNTSYQGHVAILTLDYPGTHNALSTELIRDVLGALHRLDPRQARAVVLAANGRFFSAGANIQDMHAGNWLAGHANPDDPVALYEALATHRLPVVAAVAGPALGGGFELMLSCDLAVAADTAWFSTPEVGLGVLPSTAMARLPALIGRRRAIEIMMTRRRIAASEALALGLVNELRPSGEVLAAAVDLARRAVEGAFPGALAVLKNGLDRQAPTDWHEVRAVSGRLPETQWREGLAAFLEKRAPDYDAHWSVAADPPAPFVPQMRLYQNWLRDRHGLVFDSYDALWKWSVTDLPAFWQSIWDFFGMRSPHRAEAVLADARMPGARWFPGAQANYAREVLRHARPAHAAGMLAIVAQGEQGFVREVSWPQLQRQTAAMALTLRGIGVKRGDRVVAYLPNVPEAIVAFLACASIGAVWSVCATDMGTPAVLERFRQIEPVVLIAVDGVHHGGRVLDRSAVVEDLRAALPSVRNLVLIRTAFALRQIAADIEWSDAVARDDSATAAFEPEWLPFDHPLWIVYSSGTTGLPKAIVHGHGGIILNTYACGIHQDLGASYEANSFGERYHWYTSTGWVMWNAQMSGLAFGVTVCIYDGHPAGSKDAPDWSLLWRFAARHRVTFFGAGAAYHSNCMKAGLVIQDCGDVSRIRAVGSTGSPLPEDVQRWLCAQLGDPFIFNISGGTDFCGAFVGGNRELAQVPGRMQCRFLGAAVQAWSEAGQAVTGEVGELVCVQPIPSMPLFLWGDEGNARYLASYFDTFPGVWRQGDWLRIDHDGSCVIYGRSDATINRHGLRMGTSEIYSAVEGLPEVLDSMVVDLEYLGQKSYMPLFVVLRHGVALDDALVARINDAIRTSLSPRFLPDGVFQVAEIPRTLSNKKQELPIKKLLLGQPLLIELW